MAHICLKKNFLHLKKRFSFSKVFPNPSRAFTNSQMDSHPITNSLKIEVEGSNPVCKIFYFYEKIMEIAPNIFAHLFLNIS